MSTHHRYHGTSNNQNLQEALDAAIAEAERAANENAADIIVHWRLEGVTGEAGGFTGQRKITVEIEAHW